MAETPPIVKQEIVGENLITPNVSTLVGSAKSRRKKLRKQQAVNDDRLTQNNLDDDDDCDLADDRAVRDVSVNRVCCTPCCFWLVLFIIAVCTCISWEKQYFMLYACGI